MAREGGGRRSPAARLLALALLIAAPLAAQVGEPRMELEPERCFVRGAITVRGWVQRASVESEALTLRFFAPGAAEPIARTVALEPDGHYESRFADTRVVGTWRVEALLAGRPAGQATFEVGRSVFLADLARTLRDELEPRIRSLTQELREEVRGWEASEGRQQIEGELARLLGELDEVARLSDSFHGKALEFDRALPVHFDTLTPEAVAALAEFAGETEAVRHQVLAGLEEVDTYHRQMAEDRAATPPPPRPVMALASLALASQGSGSSTAQSCADRMYWADLLDLMGKAVDYTTKGAEQLLDSAIRKKLIDVTLKPPLNTLLGAAIAVVSGGVAAAGAPSVAGVLLAVGGIVWAVSPLVIEATVANDCARWEGNVDGQYRATLSHKGFPFLQTSYVLSGKMRLMYDINDPSDLAGNFRGAGRRFRCSFDVDQQILDSYGIKAGVLAFSLCPEPRVPARFNLSLAGEVSGGLMEVRLEKVLLDFELWTFAYLIGMDQGFAGMPWLDGDIFKFPFMNAEWYVTRVTKLSQPDVDHFELTFREVTAQDPALTVTEIAFGAFDRSFHFPETQRRAEVDLSMNVVIELKQREGQPTPPTVVN